MPKEGDGADVVGEELEVIDLEDEEYVPPTEEGRRGSTVGNLYGIYMGDCSV